MIYNIDFLDTKRIDGCIGFTIMCFSFVCLSSPFGKVKIKNASFFNFEGGF